MDKKKTIVSGNGMGMHVVEDSDYNLSLKRIDGMAMRLYMVQLREEKDGKRTTIHYVLAEDERGAMLQCADNLGAPPMGTATRLPLHIRGWSHTEF